MDVSRRVVVSSLLGLSTGLVGCATQTTSPAAASSQAQQVVDGAVTAVQAMKASASFAGSGLLGRAKGVLIVPGAVKVALVAGGSGGSAVLVGRTATGWSNPAFYTVGAGSLGPQIGIQDTTTVLLLMTDKALNALLKNSGVTLGASAGLTVAQYGASGAAAVGGQDVVVWTNSKGLFIGGSVAAQGFSQDFATDQAYYGFAGQNMTAAEILAGAARNPGADKLVAAL